MSATSRYQVLEDEPASRLPVCVLIDTSFSMQVVTGGKATGEIVTRDDGQRFRMVTGGENPRIEMLLSALGGFVNDIVSDVRARASVEMAIVGFGDAVTIERDFLPVDDSLKSFSIKAEGDGTRLGQAVKIGLDLLDRRKQDYNDYGIGYYQPQLVVLTDGKATDPDVCKNVAPRLQARMNAGKLICLPFLIGNEKDTQSLQLFAPKGNLFRVDGVNLAELFGYLSQSAIKVSQSNAGGTESVTLEKMLADLKQITVPIDQV